MIKNLDFRISSSKDSVFLVVYEVRGIERSHIDRWSSFGFYSSKEKASEKMKSLKCAAFVSKLYCHFFVAEHLIID